MRVAIKVEARFYLKFEALDVWLVRSMFAGHHVVLEIVIFCSKVSPAQLVDCFTLNMKSRAQILLRYITILEFLKALRVTAKSKFTLSIFFTRIVTFAECFQGPHEA